MIAEFKGECIGVRLVCDDDDPHIRFQIIVEDDGNWAESSDGETSCHWLPELAAMLGAARTWLDANAKATAYGWDRRS